jgi:phosphoenolpyruvate carboxylase
MTAPVTTFAARDDATITAQITRTVEHVALVTVTDHATYAQAGEDLVALKQLEQCIKEHYDEDCATAHKLHKSLTSKRTAALTAVTTARAYLTAQRTAYQAEQERLRREAERAAQAAIQAEEQARALADAALLEQQGQPELAASVVEAALTATPAPIVIPSDLPKTDGVAIVERWDFEVLNARLVPAEYLMVDEKKVGAVVRAMKGETRIPGIRVFAVKGERVTA